MSRRIGQRAEFFPCQLATLARVTASVLRLTGTVLLSLLPAVQARDLFVSPAGADHNPGTAGQPLATIQKAVNLARPGDNILVGAGRYSENITVRQSGLPGQYITLRGTRGPAGEYLSVLDVSRPLSGWQPAPEVGQGAYCLPFAQVECVTWQGRQAVLLAGYRINNGQRRIPVPFSPPGPMLCLSNCCSNPRPWPGNDRTRSGQREYASAAVDCLTTQERP